MALPYQVYHILNDYMGATGKSSLPFNHTPNSAVCAGSVWAYNHNTANMTTMCAGSKTSGKSDMSMLNLFIPGEQIKPAAGRLLARVTAMGGPSVLGKGGQPWPGFDVCNGCPLFNLTWRQPIRNLPFSSGAETKTLKAAFHPATCLIRFASGS